MQVTNEQLAKGLQAEGLGATVAGLGGNIVGVEIVSGSGAQWVVSADDKWYLGRDDDSGDPCSTFGLDSSVDELVLGIVSVVSK